MVDWVLSKVHVCSHISGLQLVMSDWYIGHMVTAGDVTSLPFSFSMFVSGGIDGDVPTVQLVSVGVGFPERWNVQFSLVDARYVWR